MSNLPRNSRQSSRRRSRAGELYGFSSETFPLLQNVIRADRFSLWMRLVRLGIEETELKSLISSYNLSAGLDGVEVPNKSLNDWLAEASKSAAEYRRREALQLKLNYDESLPIYSHREAIVASIRDNPVTIVCGETGSGKSTQLPKLCWEAGLGRQGWIGHTQPRRIAARAIASRLAAELESDLGKTVGYKIRFTDRVDASTIVKLMTDGILLTEVRHNHLLDTYDCLIIDEAHERSINIDLTLTYIKRILQRRKDLRIVITSATIDAEKFAEYFGQDETPAPIFYVSGRSYPVEIRYRPFAENPNAFQDAIDELKQESDGDVLVFLPTERDIRLAEKTLRGHFTDQGRLDRIELLTLYARMTESDQQRIFNPGSKQRIILATNVAESSLTVPSVRNVVDFGSARISRYAPRSKVQRLPIESVSQASANQRAGRCGRVADGICIRLYSEEDFAGRSAFTTPEIRRANLASVMLQVKLAGIKDLESLSWLEPPMPESIRDARATLHELNAIDEDENLTHIGRQLGKWPVDPRIAKILLSADENRCLADCLIIAAGLEILDPRMRPAEHQMAADQAQQQFLHAASDFGSMLLLWDFYHRERANLSRSKFDRYLQKLFLSPARFREWLDVHRQLQHLTEMQKMKIGPRRWFPVANAAVGKAKQDKESTDDPVAVSNKEQVKELLQNEDYAAVHKSLLSGLLSGIAMAREDGKYHASARMEVQIWPGSGVRRTVPRWVVAAELVETTTRFARNVAAIDDAWIPPLASHLIKYSYESPHFSAKTGRAMIHRKASLFGLPVAPRDRVALAPIDAKLARDLLIDEGIVSEQLQTRAKFLKHNKQLLEEVAEYANRTRQRELVVDRFFLEQFYHQRIPEFILDRNSLEAWDRELRADDASDLSPYLKWETLLNGIQRDEIILSFPDRVDVGSATVSVSYHFAPGTETDGITAVVPDTAVGQISEDRIGWLVPGLLRDRVLALIKSLPKKLRRNLSPAPDTADLASKELAADYLANKPFWPSLCKVLSKISGETIRRSDFDTAKVPAHLNMQIAVLGDNGELKTIGRDIEKLRSELQVEQDAAPAVTVDENWLKSQPWYRAEMKDFDIESLPEQIVTQERGAVVTRFPTLIDHTTHVSTVVVDHPEIAAHRLNFATLRLLAISFNRELKNQVRHLPGLRDAAMRLARRIPGPQLEEGLALLLVKLALIDGKPPVTSRSDFEARKVGAFQKISVAAAEVGRWLPKMSDAVQQLSLTMETSRLAAELGDDCNVQLAQLFQPQFLVKYPWNWLREYPRFINAVDIRIKKWNTGGQIADRKAVDVLKPYIEVLSKELSSGESLSGPDESLRQIDGVPIGELSDLQWMLEELRVSLFAQQLGTSISVSPKRLDKIVDRLANR